MAAANTRRHSEKTQSNILSPLPPRTVSWRASWKTFLITHITGADTTLSVESTGSPPNGFIAGSICVTRM